MNTLIIVTVVMVSHGCTYVQRVSVSALHFLPTSFQIGEDVKSRK